MGVEQLPWLLYGCYGYSGELIVEEAIKKGLKPILAGRSAQRTKALAYKYQLPFRVFGLSDQQEIERNIKDCFLVYNAAGPYTSTCIPLLGACLETGTHNLSLVGEIPLLEELLDYDDAAKSAGIILAVGLGFDVHPTDCIAATLKEIMPDATHLTIGIDGSTEMSPGSLKEFIEQMGEQPFWVREQGKLIESSPKTAEMDFGNGSKFAMTIAWGDTASAYHSTGIPNIDIYAAVNRFDWLLMRFMTYCKPVFKIKRVQHFANRCIDKFASGPNEKLREKDITYLSGEVSNKAGDKIRLKYTVPSAYKITYLSAVYAIEAVLKSKQEKSGYFTPSQLLGASSILEIEGVSDFEFETL